MDSDQNQNNQSSPSSVQPSQTTQSMPPGVDPIPPEILNSASGQPTQQPVSNTQEQNVATVVSASAESQATSGQKRILIVEDELFIRELYARVLRAEGYAVDEAGDGLTGYQMMQKGGYDIVLLDIMLPHMDGIKILEKLQGEAPPPQPNKAILILTNLDQDMIIAKGIALGVRGYIVKSQLTPEQVKHEVKNYL
jgi:CheY-like chemotaxis protein